MRVWITLGGFIAGWIASEAHSVGRTNLPPFFYELCFINLSLQDQFNVIHNITKIYLLLCFTNF